MKKITYTLLLILSIQLQAMEQEISSQEHEVALVLASLNLINETCKVQTDLANLSIDNGTSTVESAIEKVLNNAASRKKQGISTKPLKSINHILQSNNISDEQIRGMRFNGKTLIKSISNITGFKNYTLSNGAITTQDQINTKKIDFKKYINALLNGTIKRKRASLGILKKIKNNNISPEELSNMSFMSHNKKISFLKALELLDAKTALKLFEIKNGTLSYNKKALETRSNRLEYSKNYIHHHRKK